MENNWSHPPSPNGRSKGITKLLPDLVWLFNIRQWTAAATLDFTSDARTAFANISHNCPAGTLIAKVSLPYIGSVAWQSGLLRRLQRTVVKGLVLRQREAGIPP